MKPDRIFLAEVRGDECFHFVRLAASGHPGSITSVHAGSCALAFEQMALMIRESGAGGGLRMNEIKWLLGVVVDVVVQFDRDERGRFVPRSSTSRDASAWRAGTTRCRRRREARRGAADGELAGRTPSGGRRLSRRWCSQGSRARRSTCQGSCSCF
jgi:Flp pilus assembly CpaF family ATPase